MHDCLIFSFVQDKPLSGLLQNKLSIPTGQIEIRDFPDGESYLRIETEVKNKIIFFVCSLDHPNAKILPLLFALRTIKELGAIKICLITPYLPYMRQDKRFHEGEAVTARLFAQLLSDYVDYLVTMDPHLHRIHRLSDIYTISGIATLHATSAIAEWIVHHINSPFIIGPDAESEQWVDEVAARVQVPYAIISKVRYGDREVRISMPAITDGNKTPVLLDDIISTGTSMLAAISQLKAKGFNKIVCIATHALFDNDVYANLMQAGASDIITSNSIMHFTNQIDISDTLIQGLAQLGLLSSASS